MNSSQNGPHEYRHVRHNAHTDGFRCRKCLGWLYISFPRGRRPFTLPGNRQKRVNPTKAAARLNYTPEQSMKTRTDPHEFRLDSRVYDNCPGEEQTA